MSEEPKPRRGRPISPFESEEFRTAFLALIATGTGRYKAAETLKATPRQLRYYCKAHPEFRDEIIDAEDASVDDVLAMAREKALSDNDVAWAALYIKNRKVGRANDPRRVEHVHRVELDGGNDVVRLQRMLEERAQSNVLEADVEEEEDTDD